MTGMRRREISSFFCSGMKRRKIDNMYLQLQYDPFSLPLVKNHQEKLKEKKNRFVRNQKNTDNCIFFKHSMDQNLPLLKEKPICGCWKGKRVSGSEGVPGRR